VPVENGRAGAYVEVLEIPPDGGPGTTAGRLLTGPEGRLPRWQSLERPMVYDPYAGEALTESDSSLGEAIDVDDVAVEMNGLDCRFEETVNARNPAGATHAFAAGATAQVTDWNGTGADALIAGFPISKISVAPHYPPVAAMREYAVALGAQRKAIRKNERQLREWLVQEPSGASGGRSWEEEKSRLEDLLSRRRVVYSRMWVRQMMYNRFDQDIERWTGHYNGMFSPNPALDPNIPKSLFYQESRMGTSGAHLMPPPSDWSSPDHHPLRSRFNIGQAIDSWGPQQFLMIREMGPAIATRHGLDALATGSRWFAMSNADYAAHPTFMRAMKEFFQARSSAGRNLMGTPGRDLHEDYTFWIRTALRWLFEKFRRLTRSSWSEAVRAYNGSGSSALQYRIEVMSRVGDTDPFAAEAELPAIGGEIVAPRVPERPETEPDRAGSGERWGVGKRNNRLGEDFDIAEDRSPSLDTSARLEWEDLTKITDSQGGQQVFYLVTGAPHNLAPPGKQGHAIFHIRVHNTNSVYNHKNVSTKYRSMHVLPNRQLPRDVAFSPAQSGPDLEDEHSRQIEFSLLPETLSGLYNSDEPLTRVEMEYHWRETFEDYQKHYNTAGLEFALVAPIEFMLSQKTRLDPQDILLNDPKYKDDFWIPLPVSGVDFTQDIRTPVTFRLDVSTSVSQATQAEQQKTASHSSSKTTSTSTSKTFSLQLSGEISQGQSASATIDILTVGLTKAFKLGGILGYSRTRTDTRSDTVAREFSESLKLSRSYSATQATTGSATITISPPESVAPTGTGSRSRPPAPVSVGVYLYPLIAFFDVPYVKFTGINRYGQATARTTGNAAVPFITSWRVTSIRGG
jgi:hypothetical protein